MPRGIAHRPGCSQPEPVTKRVEWLMNVPLLHCPECGRAAAIDPTERPQRPDPLGRSQGEEDK